NPSRATRQIEIGYSDDQLFQFASGTVQNGSFTTSRWLLTIEVLLRDLGASAVVLRFFREIIESEELPLSCPICDERKEKRFCPAVHGRICPQCCGEQREVTLDCPSDCPYLQQAREHEKPRSAEEFEAASLFPQVEISEQFTYEREHLLMGLTYALAKAARADRSLNDPDLIAALSATSTSHERLVNSRLHYEQPLASGVQHAVALQVEEMVK